MFISRLHGNYCGLCLHTPSRDGSSPSSEETHSLVGQLDTEEAPINVGQNLSYDFSLVLDQCFGPHDSFTLLACQSLSYLKVICIHPVVLLVNQTAPVSY